MSSQPIIPLEPLIELTVVQRTTVDLVIQRSHKDGYPTSQIAAIAWLEEKDWKIVPALIAFKAAVEAYRYANKPPLLPFRNPQTNPSPPPKTRPPQETLEDLRRQDLWLHLLRRPSTRGHRARRRVVQHHLRGPSHPLDRHLGRQRSSGGQFLPAGRRGDREVLPRDSPGRYVQQRDRPEGLGSIHRGRLARFAGGYG